MRALLKAIRRGNLPAEITVVISDKADAPVLDIARKNNIHAHAVSAVSPTIRDSVISDILKQHQVDVVVLAGYLKLIRQPLLKHYQDRIVNIHPGPLPRFGGKGMHGLAVHEAVLKADMKDSGPTVHLVNEEFDKGEILDHISIPVLEDDTPESLAERILPFEHDLYWRAIRRNFCK
jgi:formyltetrahydrofolate-dependent phosphoribosylglycinamide formyltransferase